MRFAFFTILAAACATAGWLGHAPAAFADPHPGWAEAGDGKGEFGYLKDWLFGDDKITRGAVNSKFFKDIMTKSKPYPAALIKDALVLGTDTQSMQSKACISGWGCGLFKPALEIVALRRDAADKDLLVGALKPEAVWQKSGEMERALIIRVLGWYADKSVVPFVAQLAAFGSGEYTNDALEAAAALLGVWKDKSVVDLCKATFAPDRNGERQIERARMTCAWYLMRVGEGADIAARLKRASTGNGTFNLIAGAAFGDAGAKADWQAAVKEHAKNPGNPAHQQALVGLALTGDKGAEKQIIGLLTGKDEDPAREHAMLLQAYQDTAVGGRVLAGAKKAIAKMPTKGLGGQTRALLIGMALRQGDAALVKDAKAIFDGDNGETRNILAHLLGKGNYSGSLELPSNGLAGGAPVPGLEAVLGEAFSMESDKTTRGWIARAWAMIKVHGG
ncbi:MAG: hypothetical protein FJ100_18790 [Deltaproteobacteria bacterium]|nr:hypothetical protein [Deltaproteobacteria bacterium]